MRHLDLRRAGGLTATVALAAGLVVTAPAVAEPEPTAATQPTTTRITLITGDVLTVRGFADGHESIVADPTGPSRGIVSLYAWEGERYANPGHRPGRRQPRPGRP